MLNADWNQGPPTRAHWLHQWGYVYQYSSFRSSAAKGAASDSCIAILASRPTTPVRKKNEPILEMEAIFALSTPRFSFSLLTAAGRALQYQEALESPQITRIDGNMLWDQKPFIVGSIRVQGQARARLQQAEAEKWRMAIDRNRELGQQKCGRWNQNI